MGDDGGLFGLGLGSRGRTFVLSGLNACQPHGVSVLWGDVLTDTASHRSL